MLKKSLRYPIIYFFAAALSQLIIHQQVKWMHNLGICFLIFLFMLFYHWASVPFNWNKNKSR